MSQACVTGVRGWHRRLTSQIEGVPGEGAVSGLTQQTSDGFKFRSPLRSNRKPFP